MRGPRTLLIPDDDEPTIVDPRCARRLVDTPVVTLAITPDPDSAPGPPFAGSGVAASCGEVATTSGVDDSGWPSWVSAALRGLSSRWPYLLGGILLVASFSGLFTMIHSERRIADGLRETVAELSRTQREILERTAISPIVSEPGRADITTGRRPSSTASRLDREGLELRGAELLVANDHGEALHHYRALAKQFPEERVFAEFAAVLEWMLRCEDTQHMAVGGCR